MKKKIESLLIWFQTDEGRIAKFTDLFFGITLLFNRLLNETYEGKKIKFINVNLETIENYKKHPEISLNYTHYYNGHLNFYGLFEKEIFEELNFEEQSIYVWDKIFKALIECSKTIKNQALFDATMYTYSKGLENNLSTDYKVLEQYFDRGNESYSVCVLFSFKKDGIYSKLLIKKDDIFCYERDLDSTVIGNGYFLTIYKDLSIINDTLILKGKSEI